MTYDYPDRESVPKLNIKLPRSVTRLHQIEITSRCNLRCVYCPSRKMPKRSTEGDAGYRFQLDMTEEHFELALRHAEFHFKEGMQSELNLAGIGESTLHPRFIDFLAEARARLGEDAVLIMATNGVGYDEDLVERMSEYRPAIYVSLHRPEKAAKAVQWFKKRGMLHGVSADPSINSNDWAGQVDWHISHDYTMACFWIREGRAMAMADGRITACCIDATGRGAIGHVSDPPGTLKTRPWELCGGCHQEIAVAGYDQRQSVPTERLVTIGVKK